MSGAHSYHRQCEKPANERRKTTIVRPIRIVQRPIPDPAMISISITITSTVARYAVDVRDADAPGSLSNASGGNLFF